MATFEQLFRRILTFVVGISLLLSIILFMPWINYLVLNLLVLFAILAGSWEMIGLFGKKGVNQNRGLLLLAATLFPLATYLMTAGFIPTYLGFMSLGLAIYIILVRQIHPRSDSFSPSLTEASAGVLIILYPGVFLSFVTRITGLPNPSLLLIVFITLVFVNDTGAYLFGILFGAKNRGIIKASPGKSTIGFVAGIVLTLGAGAIFYVLLPEVFAHSWLLSLGCAVGVASATILGDLVESVMKRSAEVKDSGNLIPGRGGVLDSIDSIAFSAPVFYLLMFLGTKA